MTLPRTAADVLSDHVSFEVECIDRMYLNVCVPQLQYAAGLVSYIHRQLGKPVASTVALAPVSEAFTRSVRAFAASGGIAWVDFAKGQRKDDVAREYLAGFTAGADVLLDAALLAAIGLQQLLAFRHDCTTVTTPAEQAAATAELGKAAEALRGLIELAEMTRRSGRTGKTDLS